MTLYLIIALATHICCKFCITPIFIKKVGVSVSSKTPGLACALAGIKHPDQITESLRGSLFESYIFLNLLAVSSVSGGELFYFRTQGGREREVDFILEIDGKVIAIEV